MRDHAVNLAFSPLPTPAHFMAQSRAQAKHLLVDGYNIIHQWPELARLLKDFGVEAARAQLGECLRPIHDSEHYRVTIVFDGRGKSPEIERPSPDLTFSFLFTPTGITADQMIEELVSTAKYPLEIIVATRDNLLTETVGANGGLTLSPQQLLDWVDSCRKRVTAIVQDQNRSSRARWRNARNADMQPPSSH